MTPGAANRSPASRDGYFGFSDASSASNFAISGSITDRGPARRLNDRVIDLTRASFARIAPLERGLVPVRVERLAESGRITSSGLPTGPTGPGSR